MINIVVKPNSRRDGDKWIPEGVVSFPSGPDVIERSERCEEVEFNSKEEADRHFVQACRKKYKIVGRDY